MFVYLVTNTVNGKRYIGQTRQTLVRRWNAHACKNHCKYLYNAIQKYGKENFLVELICEVPTLDLANEFEIEYIERYRTMFPNGYNILPGGDKPRLMSEEERIKLSERMKGNKYRLGQSPSKETRLKLSEANTGKVLSETHRKKISEKLLGNKNGAYSLRNFGKKNSEESNLKRSLATKGRPKSEETRQRMLVAQQSRRLKELAAKGGISCPTLNLD